MTGTVTITVINASVLTALRRLPDKSVQFIMTSPPYLWLRNYKIAGQIGLEKTPQEFIEILVEVFRECWRVLRDDGTLWLNMGDSYAGSGKGPSGHTGLGCQEDRQGFHDENVHIPKGWKAGDLMGIPWMLAFALRDAGWYFRTDIVWHKPNPMPESNKTRPTRAHEFLFLFAKSGKTQFWTHPTMRGTRKKPAPDYYFVNNQTDQEGEPPENWKNLTYVEEETGKRRKLWSRRNRWIGWKYFYDAEAIREPASASYAKDKRPKGVLTQHCNANTKYEPGDQRSKVRITHKQEEVGKATYADLNKSGRGHTPTANKRDVWKIPTTQRKEKHFASFPDKLVMEALKAGSSEAGCCPSCGAPYFRQVRRTPYTMNIRVRDGKKGIISDKSGLGVQYQASDDEIANYGPEEAGTCETVGWTPTCDCNAGDPVPCTVMDPFCGRGTVLIVGRRMGRSGIGIDLNPEYCQMVKKNLEAEDDKPGIPAMEFNLCEGPAEPEIQKSPCIRKGQITLEGVTA